MDLYNLRFALERSRRYHQRRVAFLQTAQGWATFGVVLSGLLAFFAHPWFGLPMLLSALIYYRLDPTAHLLLQFRFSDLLMEAQTSESLSHLQSKRIEIEKNEPATYCALEADCYNELVRAQGKPDYQVKITPWQMRLRHFLRFETTPFTDFVGSSATSSAPLVETPSVSPRPAGGEP